MDKPPIDKNQYSLVSQEPKLDNNENKSNMARYKRIPLEEALTLTGLGKYNYYVLLTGCLLVLTMSVDIFGFSVVLPPAACDMGLTTAQQGLLSAIPLIGVMLSSYWWGLCADTLGRRKTLLISMPFSVFLNFASGLAPNYPLLAISKFLSACLGFQLFVDKRRGVRVVRRDDACAQPEPVHVPDGGYHAARPAVHWQ